MSREAVPALAHNCRLDAIEGTLRAPNRQPGWQQRQECHQPRLRLHQIEIVDLPLDIGNGNQIARTAKNGASFTPMSADIGYVLSELHGDSSIRAWLRLVRSPAERIGPSG